MEATHCDLCDQPATVHATEIHNGIKTHQHLCAVHARQAGFDEMARYNPTAGASAEDQATMGLLNNLRSFANYTRRYGRPPASVPELEEGRALKGDFPTIEIQDPELEKQVQWMERIMSFIETHKRMPDAGESATMMP